MEGMKHYGESVRRANAMDRAAKEFKHFAWGIVDETGNPCSGAFMRQSAAIRLAEQWNDSKYTKGDGFRVVEIFYKDEQPASLEGDKSWES